MQTAPHDTSPASTRATGMRWPCPGDPTGRTCAPIETSASGRRLRHCERHQRLIGDAPRRLRVYERVMRALGLAS